MAESSAACSGSAFMSLHMSHVTSVHSDLMDCDIICYKSSKKSS